MELMLIVITAASLALAILIGIVAWRIGSEERRRSDARVAALAADLSDVVPAPQRLPEEPTVRSRSQFARVLVVGVVAVATILGLVVVATGRAAHPVVDPAASQSFSSGNRSDTVTLELVALSHEHDGDHITVRGAVRNPGLGEAVDQLDVVVFLFDRDGVFLESGRAAVHPAPLAPGAESTFVVRIGGATDAGRYRVSFRSRDRVIRHVDRRSPGPIAQVK
jgi:hypothetical protein